MKYSVKTKGN